MAAPLLEIENLSVTFPGNKARRRVPAVDGLCFSIEPGQTLALVGESGCGKSLTALAIMRLIAKPGRIEPGSRIVFAGEDVLAAPVPRMRALRGAAMAMIFQEPMASLNPVQKVGTQLVEAIRLHEKISGRAAMERAGGLFERVGIPGPRDRLAAYPHQLSGGLRQRVMIAMMIAMKPRLLIADEPTTALDVTVQAQILALLRQIQDDLGTAILLITHDFGVVNELADRLAVMYAGRIAEEGSRREILGHPRHPYTRGLLRSIPGASQRGQPLEEISGTVPAPGDWPAGCRFTSRCPQAFAPCAGEPPPEIVLGPGHRVRCHAATGEPGS
ncbi:MAG: ABC transporter ATP-binding protein [Alphaproteobacteria bacterium]